MEQNKKEYIAIKDIKGNEDLHQIAKRIKFEEHIYMPKDTTREQFLQEIKTQIEWELDMLIPSVSKTILAQEYMKILKIEEKESKKKERER